MIWKNTTRHRAAMSSFENVPVEELRIRPVKNCIVTKSQLVLTKSGVTPYCLFDNVPIKNRYKFNLVAIGSSLKNRLLFLDNRSDYYFLMNVWSLGYHHWLAEVSIKFFLFEDILRAGRILLPENRPRYIQDFIDAFGFENIVSVPENAFVRRLNVITNPHSGHFNPDHISLLRRSTTSRMGFETSVPKRLIYVTRKSANVRRVLNDEEVRDYLSGRGFDCLDLENVPFIDQLKIFAEAKTLVSIHGAALTNSVFMNTGGRVIEFYPQYQNRENELNACFFRLANVSGLNHEFLFSQRENPETPLKFRSDNIYVDVQALGKLLDR